MKPEELERIRKEAEGNIRIGYVFGQKQILELCDEVARLQSRQAKMQHALILANDALYECAGLGKMMPGEYDSFLDAYAELENQPHQSEGQEGGEG